MTTANEVLDQCRKWIGFKEKPGNGTPFGVWYGLPNQPYCAMALSYCSFQAGLPIAASTSKGYAWTVAGVQYFKRLGRWSTTPSVGAHVFFKFPGEGRDMVNHVGIVESINSDGSINTIEFNTQDGCFRRKRKAYIVGYGAPAYSAKSEDHAGTADEVPGSDLSKPAVSIQYTPDGKGYRIFAEDGGVFCYGNAGFMGSAANLQLQRPIVAAVGTSTGLGYWLVAADGGVFSYGDAKFFGSMGGKPLNKPIVGVDAGFDNTGYALVAADGGVFAFGSAEFHGSPVK